MRYALFALVGVAGCDLVWNVRAVGDAGAVADAAPDAPDGGICRMVERQVDADVILYSTTTTMGHNTAQIMNIGFGQSGEGLQRFTVPVLAPGETIRAMHLVETYVVNADECKPGCLSCAYLDRAGPFHVAYATSMWNEATACYAYPDIGGAMWNLPGAMGTDRSEIIGTGTYAPTTDFGIDLDVTKLSNWIQGDQLSVILTGENNGPPPAQIVVPQKDYNTCTPMPQPVHIDFMLCH